MVRDGFIAAYEKRRDANVTLTVVETGDAALEQEPLQALAKDGVRHVVVSPAGFVCDHVEVLYDLDVELRWVAAEHGITLHRAPAVNAHPAFISMLADLVQEARA